MLQMTLNKICLPVWYVVQERSKARRARERAKQKALLRKQEAAASLESQDTDELLDASLQHRQRYKTSNYRSVCCKLIDE